MLLVKVEERVKQRNKPKNYANSWCDPNVRQCSGRYFSVGLWSGSDKYEGHLGGLLVNFSARLRPQSETSKVYEKYFNLPLINNVEWSQSIICAESNDRPLGLYGWELGMKMSSNLSENGATWNFFLTDVGAITTKNLYERNSMPQFYFHSDLNSFFFHSELNSFYPFNCPKKIVKKLCWEFLWFYKKAIGIMWVFNLKHQCKTHMMYRSRDLQAQLKKIFHHHLIHFLNHLLNTIMVQQLKLS